MSDAKQNQRSQQSIDNPAGNPEQKPAGKADDKAGIGSSQGQDRASREDQPATRPSAGTADIERGADTPANTGRGGDSEESLVNESTGAFKERP